MMPSITLARNKQKSATRSESCTKPVILLADSSSHTSYMAALFELANFVVRTAQSAEECIEVFNGTKDKIVRICSDLFTMIQGAAG